MYFGTNPTALRSQKVITDAFLILLETEPYDKITVKEIVGKAMVSRQTYYQIFKSKEEILEYHISILFNEYKKTLAESAVGVDVYQIIYGFFNFFYSHKNVIEILVQNKLTGFLTEQFEQYLEEVKKLSRNYVEIEHPDYVTAFFSGALVEVLVHWHKDGFFVSVETMTIIFMKIIGGVIGRH